MSAEHDNKVRVWLYIMVWIILLRGCGGSNGASEVQRLERRLERQGLLTEETQ